MSVVIGIRCSDGIVIGSDSVATLTSQGIVTAQQHSMKKVAAKGRVLSAIAGSTGLGQRIRARLEAHLNEGQWTGDRQQVMSQMRRDLWSNLVECEIRAAKTAADAFGQPSYLDAARTQTLVATIIDDNPELIHLDETCSPSPVEHDVPLCAIGAGQQTADPFLAFVRRVLWADNLPTIAVALMTVAWTLIHVIDANPNGIGHPLQMGVLQRDRNEWIARVLGSAEIQEHTDSVTAVEDGIREKYGKKSLDELTPPAPK
jgi:20S proteasome alpha/beta subunit